MVLRFFLLFHEMYDEGIALDKTLFSTKNYWYFSYFSTKTYVVVLIRSASVCGASNEYHNICFHGEIRKLFTGYPLLSRLMKVMLEAPMKHPKHTQWAHDVYTTSHQCQCSIMALHQCCLNVACPLGIALDTGREHTFSAKKYWYFFLFLQDWYFFLFLQENILWVLIRNALARRFKWVHTPCVFPKV